ncbi:MAG: hypothetical protein H0W78_16605 [Planctomycetes bacterium]|nr:hypothetical protein [Planctomycetota bacterium]
MNTLARHSFRLLLCLALGLALQLHAATAKDIQGEWLLDGAATWEAMKTSPQIAAMPPDQQKMVGEMMVKQMSGASTTVTADKLISTKPDGMVEESTYKVTKTEGDKVTTESTKADGTVETTEITVTGDTLLLKSPSHPGMTIVMKRKAAK